MLFSFPSRAKQTQNNILFFCAPYRGRPGNQTLSSLSGDYVCAAERRQTLTALVSKTIKQGNKGTLSVFFVSLFSLCLFLFFSSSLLSTLSRLASHPSPQPPFHQPRFVTPSLLRPQPSLLTFFSAMVRFFVGLAALATVAFADSRCPCLHSHTRTHLLFLFLSSVSRFNTRKRTRPKNLLSFSHDIKITRSIGLQLLNPPSCDH